MKQTHSSASTDISKVRSAVSVFKMPLRTLVTKLPVDEVYNLNKRC